MYRRGVACFAAALLSWHCAKRDCREASNACADDFVCTQADGDEWLCQPRPTAAQQPGSWGEWADTQAELSQIRGFVDVFWVMHSRLPSGLTELSADIGPIGPITREDIETDLWGNPYEYRTTGTSYEVYSVGPDGRPATEDDVHPTSR